MSKPILGYWNIRGYAQEIRHLLQYLGVEYIDKQYPYRDEVRNAWLEDKFNLGLRFPNIPYFIDEKFSLTESKAILKYIARTRGPEIVPDSVFSQAFSDEVEGVATDLQHTIVDIAYAKDTNVTYEEKREAVEKKWEYLNTHLGNHSYAAGGKITYIDFYLYEVLFQCLRFAEAKKDDLLKPYDNLTKYVRQIESLPQMKAYCEANAKFVCYSPYATLYF